MPMTTTENVDPVHPNQKPKYGENKRIETDEESTPESEDSEE